MRILIAAVLKFLFRFSFLRKRWYGIYKRIIRPLNLFHGLKRLYKFRGEIIFELHLDDWIQQNIYFLGEYESAELNFLEKNLKSGNIFVDIGANIGVHSLVAAKKVEMTGKVLSFEPYPRNITLIEKNIELNKLQNVKLEHFGISDTSKSISLYYNEAEFNQGMVSAYANEFSQHVDVDVISLDEYFKQNEVSSVDFIKIDIEGGEFPALIGMSETLKRFHPTLLIELDDEILAKTNFKKMQIVDFLKNIGYKQFFLDDLGNISEMENVSQTKNCVFKFC